MSPTLAMVILSWIAIVILYLALAAVLREVRMLRRHVDERAATAAAPAELQLPAPFVERIAEPGRERTVLVADASCPLCRYATAVLAEVATPEFRPVLLTYEPPERWSTLPETVQVVQDRDAWSSLAHLSPPVLLTVGTDGTVGSLHLPSSERDIAAALAVTPAAPLIERSSS
ncbi:hypothetical protein ABZW18_06135 [Streptomyces sp. NPDC004647]|uniref:hypothetical protein n=1 Tax=Streptomyces sp. NPDC004647 TaxID=3154671 RepID=UPI0033B8819B